MGDAICCLSNPSDRGLWRTDLAAQRRGARALQEASMFGSKQESQKTTSSKEPTPPPVPLLTIVGDTAKMEGKFQIADSIQIECEVGGELRVGGKLVIGEKGVVNANVETVDAVILGHYDGNMTATGNVEIAATGRVSGNIKTDSLVITKGGCFKGNVAKINEEPGSNHRPRYVVEDKLVGPLARDNGQMLDAGRLPEVGRKV
jgi:cytoskeletal protein CcmA (bactofilin family)